MTTNTTTRSLATQQGFCVFTTLQGDYPPINHNLMNTGKLLSDNPELLQYVRGKIHITILGGIRFTGLDRLKVTLKIVCKEDMKKVFRHNVDLYNSIQTTQIIERSADFLDIPTDEMTQVINDLTTVLEDYRAAPLGGASMLLVPFYNPINCLVLK